MQRIYFLTFCAVSLIIMYIGKHLIFFHEYMLLYVLTDRKCFYSIFAGGDAARVCNISVCGLRAARVLYPIFSKPTFLHCYFF